MSLLKAFLIFTLFIASCHARPRPQPGKPVKVKEDKELFDKKMGRNSKGADKPTVGWSENPDETADEILGSRSKDASEGEAKPLIADEVVGQGTAEEETPAEAEEQGNKDIPAEKETQAEAEGPGNKDASAEEGKPSEVEGPSKQDTSAPKMEPQEKSAEMEGPGNDDATAEEGKPAEVEGPSENDTSAPQKETEGIEGSNSAESGDGPANEANEETTGDGTISGEGVESKSSTK